MEGKEITATSQGSSISDQQLFEMAKDALVNSYAPFSKFKVGAALLGNNGKVYTGVNVENSSFGATICAERTACVKAVSEGCKEFTKIAIATEEGEAFPCGICRQFLYEFAPDIDVITGIDKDNLKKYKLREMLIEGFALKGDEK